VNPFHAATILAIAMPLAGCDGLEILEKQPSPFKAEMERRALITLPSPLPSSPAEPNPVVVDVPVVEAPVPTCIETFRVNKCLGNEVIPW